jgi:hypothetical protein
MKVIFTGTLAAFVLGAAIASSQTPYVQGQSQGKQPSTAQPSGDQKSGQPQSDTQQRTTTTRNQTNRNFTRICCGGLDDFPDCEPHCRTHRSKCGRVRKCGRHER